jgi:hypothetical protein
LTAEIRAQAATQTCIVNLEFTQNRSTAKARSTRLTRRLALTDLPRFSSPFKPASRLNFSRREFSDNSNASLQSATAITKARRLN